MEVVNALAEALPSVYAPPLPPPPPQFFDFLRKPPPPPPASERGRPYLVAFIIIAFASYAWEQYLRWRTRQRLRLKGVPSAVKDALGSVDEAEYARAQEYSTVKNNFGFFKDALGIFSTLLQLYLTPLLWNRVSSTAVVWAGLDVDHEIARFVVLNVVSLPLELLLSMPLSAYSTFVIEQKYGFNNQTARSWLADALKSLAVDQVMGLLMMVPLVLLLRNLGPYAWLYAWAFITTFALVFNMLYPTLI